VLSGNTTMSAPSGLFVQATAVITNNGTFTVQSGDVLCTLCTTASFTNNGTIQKTVANTTNWSVPITGSGNLVASGGLGSLFSIQASANVSSITINGSEVGFSGSAVAIGSVSGSGTVADFGVSAGNTTVSGSVTLSGGNGSLPVSGGTMTLNGATSVDAVLLFGGTLTGSGAIVTNGNSSWKGGAITGTAPLTVNASLYIDGVFGPMTLGRNIINNALITYDAGTPANFLTVNAPASITNNGQFLIINVDDLAATGSLSLINSATGTINRTSGPATAINFGLGISNAGTTNWTVGTTTFTNGFSQSAGTTTLNGATIGSPAPFNFTGGIFNARGTVNGSVAINGATLNPGTSPGAVTITGDYTQSAAGILNVELNGTVAGTSYDQVNVGGNVNLNGTLNASVGYTPANNDLFDVLTFAGTRTGDFSTYNLLPFSGGSLQSAYVAGAPNKLRLTAVVT
jgi:fibronectin-binding autotransporter adhesin